MRDDGKAIIIITHKLHEVLSVSDRVSVLRRGEYVGTLETSKTNETELTEMMVGKKISLNIARSEPKNTSDRLVVSNIRCLSREGVTLLDNISFTARAGRNPWNCGYRRQRTARAFGGDSGSSAYRQRSDNL